MRRDKELYRLGLVSMERYPKDVVVTLLQDACIAVEVDDATRLPAALLRLLRVVAAVPRLERFVSDVCQVLRPGFDPKPAPPLPPLAST